MMKTGLYLTIASLIARTVAQNTSLNLKFETRSGSVFNINDRATRIKYNVTDPVIDLVKAGQQEGSKFYVGIMYDHKNKSLTKVVRLKADPQAQYVSPSRYNLTYYLLIPIQTNSNITYAPRMWNRTTQNQNVFLLEPVGIGFVTLGFNIHMVFANNTTEVINEEQYKITCVREQRIVDIGFNVAITVLGVVNIFGLGCVSDMSILKEQLRKSLAISVACLTQYILTPLITFGLSKALMVQNEVALGLLFCSCVPGGGLGHLVVVVLGNADIELSVALNFLQLVVSLGTAPAWLFSLGQFYPNGTGEMEPTLYFTVLWLAALIIPYSLGIIVRHFRKPVSEALLNWLVKPLLLLAFILFITLGLYINMYAFGVMSNEAIIVGTMLPFIGFGVGGALALMCKQGKPAAKTVATEAAVMNCITVIVAIRFTMPQPDADLASAAALWVLFTSLVPFIFMLIFHKIKKKILSYFEKREAEKEQQTTMLQSFAAITQNALQISGMTPEQVAQRTPAEQCENGDKTLLIGRESQSSTVSDDPIQSIVKLKETHNSTTSVETIPLSQTNNRNYV